MVGAGWGRGRGGAGAGEEGASQGGQGLPQRLTHY